MMKSTIDEIRARFDADVERFSNLDTGQVAAMDSPLSMALLAEAAAACSPGARAVLDIGCGAGNYTLKLLQQLPALDATLIDLSRPMLDRAVERIEQASGRTPETIQGDIREVDLGQARFDIVMAAQCLHHLREEAEWRDVFGRIYASLRPGGSLWISDSVDHDLPGVREVMRRRWGEYLVDLNGETYRDRVFAYVEAEDTPRPLQWQLDRMREAGFVDVDVLHKHNRFACFGAVRPG